MHTCVRKRISTRIYLDFKCKIEYSNSPQFYVRSQLINVMLWGSDVFVKVVLVSLHPISRTEPAYVIAQHRSAVWKRRTQLRPIRYLRSSSQSESSQLHLCSPLLSPPDINAFKISVKRLLAIFLPPPLLATHVQLHPDVDLLVLQLRQDARHSPAARS